MAKLFDRVKMSVSGTPGTGNITLGSAVSGFRTFATAGVSNSDIVSYVAEDGTAWEIGTATYSTTGPALNSRTVTSNSAGDTNPISLTSSAVVFSAAVRADLVNLREANDFTSAPTVSSVPLLLGSLSNITAAGEVIVHSAVRSAAASATIPAGVDAIRTTGYATVGDGGAALYKRAASEPSHSGKFQSADTAWWEIAEHELYPEMFGAVGDGTTNDSTAINAMLTAASTTKSVCRTRPETVYAIATTTIAVPGDVEFRMAADSYLKYTGTGSAVTVNAGGSASRYKRHAIAVEKSNNSWHLGTDTSSIGIVVENLRQCTVDVMRCVGFWTGLRVYGNGDGIVDNIFNLGHIQNNRFGIRDHTAAAGWSNQNTFIGGMVRVDSDKATTADTNNVEPTLIYLDTAVNWSFYNVNLEGNLVSPAQIAYVNDNWNAFHNCRYEQQGTDTFVITSSATGTQVIGGYDNHGPDSAIFADSGTDTVIIGSRGAKFYGGTGGGAAVVAQALNANTNLLFQGKNFNGNTFVEWTGLGNLKLYDTATGKEGSTHPSMIISAETSSIDFGATDGSVAPQKVLAVNNATYADLFNVMFRVTANASTGAQFGFQALTLSDGATSVTLSQGGHFKTANTGATNLSGIASGIEGMLFFIYANDANTTLVHGNPATPSGFLLRSGQNRTLARYDIVGFVCIDSDCAVEIGGFNLGTAAEKDTGTSGNTIPLLDGTNTWTNEQTFSAGVSIQNADTTITRSAAGVIAVEGVTVPLNSITNTHTALGIELGHATDTTLTRVSAGIAAVEGKAIQTAGKQTIWVPAGAMKARTTNGAEAVSAELPTNDIMIPSLNFDTATEEGAGFWITFPKSWNEGTVTFVPYWTAASGSGGVVWGLAAYAFSNDDALDTAVSGQQTSTDTLITANDLHVGPESSAITIGGTPAADDAVYFEVTREVANGSDTLDADAKLLGVKIIFTLDAAAANDD